MIYVVNYKYYKPPKSVNKQQIYIQNPCYQTNLRGGEYFDDNKASLSKELCSVPRNYETQLPLPLGICCPMYINLFNKFSTNL